MYHQFLPCSRYDGVSRQRAHPDQHCCMLNHLAPETKADSRIRAPPLACYRTVKNSDLLSENLREPTMGQNQLITNTGQHCTVLALTLHSQREGVSELALTELCANLLTRRRLGE